MREAGTTRAGIRRRSACLTRGVQGILRPVPSLPRPPPLRTRVQPPRPPLNKQTVDRILQSVEAGIWPETAAALAGVDPVTLRDWVLMGARAIQYGRELSDLEAKVAIELVNGIQQASAQFEDRCTNILLSAAVNDPKAASRIIPWVLERRFPARFGNEKIRRPSSIESAMAAQPETLDYSRLTAGQLALLDDLIQIAAGQSAPDPAVGARPANGIAAGRTNGKSNGTH